MYANLYNCQQVKKIAPKTEHILEYLWMRNWIRHILITCNFPVIWKVTDISIFYPRFGWMRHRLKPHPIVSEPHFSLIRLPCIYERQVTRHRKWFKNFSKAEHLFLSFMYLCSFAFAFAFQLLRNLKETNGGPCTLDLECPFVRRYKSFSLDATF